MHTTQRTTLLGVSTLSALLLASPFASGAGSALIVQDTFTRTGALLGSTADSGQTWTGTSAFVTTGTADQVDGSSTSFATINGLSLDINSCYILSVNVEIFFPISDGWMGFGFKSASSTDAFTGTVGTFIRPDDPEISTYVSGSSGAMTDPFIDPFPHNMTIILTTGATLADSTLDWLVGGTPIRSGEPVDANGIDGIFLVYDIVDNLQRAEFDDLRLLGPVPEPSTALLLGLMGIGSLLRRRR